jgi:hypothetical protein
MCFFLLDDVLMPAVWMELVQNWQSLIGLGIQRFRARIDLNWMIYPMLLEMPDRLTQKSVLGLLLSVTLLLCSFLEID